MRCLSRSGLPMTVRRSCPTHQRRSCPGTALDRQERDRVWTKDKGGGKNQLGEGCIPRTVDLPTPDLNRLRLLVASGSAYPAYRLLSHTEEKMGFVQVAQSSIDLTAEISSQLGRILA